MARPSNTQERRTQIARALLQVMAKTGYEGASIAEVAKVAKVAPGLVHYHFDNKLEILLAAIAELGRDYEERLERHIARAKGEPRRELRAFVDAHLRLGAEADADAVACWINVSGEALREPKVKRAFAAALSGAHVKVQGILGRGAKAGVFMCKAPADVAAAVVAIIQGYFVLSATARALVPSGSAARTTLQLVEGMVVPSAGRGDR